MALTQYTGDPSVIAKLGTTPAERGGMTADQFKAKFDEGLTAFVAWFNSTHLNELSEAGTFTPNLAGSTTAGTNTYSTQSGKYYKVGKQVHMDIDIGLSAKDAAMAGTVQIKGLPYSAATLTAAAVALASYIDLNTGYTQVGAYIAGNTINLTISGDNVAYANAAVGVITNTSRIILSVDYITA